MAKVKPEILEIIRKYISLLQENGFNILGAYLFGSYANGDPNEWSDIDLAVISSNFEGNRILDKEMILGLYRKIDLRLSVLPINPEGFDSFFIQKEVVNKGIKVA